MRNAVVIPLNDEESLVITSDNSGGIGTKEQDLVKIPYEVTGYYLFRVAVMECIAAGARPSSAVIQNFSGEEAWDELIKGVCKGLAELDMENLPVTGSTETNFLLSQSAVGINVIGLKYNKDARDFSASDKISVGLVGLPLLGGEVVSQADDVAPLSVFGRLCTAVVDAAVWPVGSKGVLHELKRMIAELKLPVNGAALHKDLLSGCDVDGLKSGGPGTCFLIAYLPEREQTIKEIAGRHFRKLFVFDTE